MKNLESTCHSFFSIHPFRISALMYEVIENVILPWMNQSPGTYLLLLFLLVVLGLGLLCKGGDCLSDHSANIANHLGVPHVVVGLTVVSIATSAPELFTSISALRSNSPGLVLGNIIGSNLANIGLILGVSLLLKNINPKGAVSLEQRICLLVVTLFFCSVLYFHPSGEFSFFPGTLLLIFLFLYLTVLTIFALKQRVSPVAYLNDSKQKYPSLSFSFLMIILATLSLWIGSDLLVLGSKKFALLIGVPEQLIGFTLIAVGTSLPELAASIALLRKDHTSMLLGNLVGSNIFNISLVGGLAGVLGPVRSCATQPWIDYFSLISITIGFIYLLGGKTLQKKQGYLLLIYYLLTCVVIWTANA